ncbi:hypothetical protein Desti_0191 [Desulfomonile tiedjei DSM 6799]|uniref:Uncharacterized protein n=1 Tax=Desulfomonile tiedjei (strain ATCC 49306 / DSM 6799 / DCB-1) TaxID=706587 RepID=I4C046_DESTA|nr:hypothetical protein Desti_0191 [Desulfomonile tiedjei DSM 6799]
MIRKKIGEELLVIPPIAGLPEPPLKNFHSRRASV